MNEALKDHFEVVGLAPHVTKVALPNIGEVDFSKISLLQAQQLHAKGCVYLKPITKMAKSTPAKKPAKDG